MRHSQGPRANGKDCQLRKAHGTPAKSNEHSQYRRTICLERLWPWGRSIADWKKRIQRNRPARHQFPRAFASGAFSATMKTASPLGKLITPRPPSRIQLATRPCDSAFLAAVSTPCTTATWRWPAHASIRPRSTKSGSCRPPCSRLSRKARMPPTPSGSTCCSWQFMRSRVGACRKLEIERGGLSYTVDTLRQTRRTASTTPCCSS